MYYGGQPLTDDMLIGSCAGELSTLDVEIRMLGGKIIFAVTCNTKIETTVLNCDS